MGVDRYRLVVHDWGVVGLALAQAAPVRVDRLVAMNVVPFLPGYRWHRIARLWRTPLVGELVMGATTKWSLRRLSRGATVAGLPAEYVDSVWAHFDQGTQRAILKLYRSAPPAVLAAAGARQGDIPAPALVLWGDRDPYIPAEFADATGAALGDATVRHLEDAGHWPWLDRPDVVDMVAEFLAGHRAIEVVHYPGLSSDPGHAIATKQMSDFGGMLSVQVKGGADAAMAVAAKVRVFTRATSFGGTESLVEHRASIEGPGTTTPANLLRVSIGLEHPDDLLEDFSQALG